MKSGRRTAGAEFCAPMTALHGHVRHLLEKTDFVFLPVTLETAPEEKHLRRQYCYYTQFAPAVAAIACDAEDQNRVLSPFIDGLYHAFHAKTQLYRMLRPLTRSRIRFLEISAAYDAALKLKTEGLSRLRSTYTEETRRDGDIHVVMLGRPYTILSPWMNKKIPDILGRLGIRAFHQEMVPTGPAAGTDPDPVLRKVHWRYAAETLRAAQAVAQTRGAYPVWITSFKCAPDAFALDYFRDIMDRASKPYLILQLDEHDSSVGYETRIEAAVRAFRNHHETEAAAGPGRGHPTAREAGRTDDLTGKTLLLPNWDPVALRLVAAGLRREGIDARLLEESETDIQKSLRRNTGQCLPLNIIAHEFADYVRNHDLDPSATALWMIKSAIACNLGLYPHHIQRLVAEIDPGMAAAAVYVGEFSFADISYRLPAQLYFAYMFGGLIQKMGCRIRPYEVHPGETDRVIRESLALMEETFSGDHSKERALAEVIARFQAIETRNEPPRPKVAIFGDLYVRDNPVMNQNLIGSIEANGGEVVITPYSDYVKMISGQYLRKWFREGKYFNAISSSALLAAIRRQEKRYYGWFQKVLGEPQPRYDTPPDQILSAYHIRREHTGESMDNILKIFYLKKHHPDIALFVQTSPAFCCPALITEAMARRIEAVTQTPVVSITYDGTGGDKNSAVIPYLRYPRRRGKGSEGRPPSRHFWQSGQ
jgi:predicted nucleotide-binding protein (sugar kinase/HSP70/actin superfamily)